MIIGNDRIFRVHGINRRQLNDISEYLQNIVGEWCAGHNPGNSFAARDLIGGKNKDWNGTPLQILYDYYLQRCQGDRLYAYKEAAKAAGRILKGVLKQDDLHNFRMSGYYKAIRYELV